jgi:two-component system, NarL family, response regulator NreC
MTLVDTKPVGILLAHQQPIVRFGIRAVLAAHRDYLVVGETGDSSEVIPLGGRLQARVLLIDANMFGGIDMIHRVLLCSPRTRVVVLATCADEGYATMILRNGAAALVVKGLAATVLPEALRETTAGRCYVSPPLTDRVVFEQAHGGLVSTYDMLTPREREVLHLSAEGHTADAVAKRLCVSRRTVEKHRANLLGKLGLHTQSDLVRYALRRGIAEQPLQTGTDG